MCIDVQMKYYFSHACRWNKGTRDHKGGSRRSVLYRCYYIWYVSTLIILDLVLLNPVLYTCRCWISCMMYKYNDSYTPAGICLEKLIRGEGKLGFPKIEEGQ